jgi:hypothetical protein
LARPDSGEKFLEIGLLLIVTGLFVGVLLLALDLVLARESKVVSSVFASVVSLLALAVVLAVVFFLVRRAKRLFRA